MTECLLICTADKRQAAPWLAGITGQKELDMEALLSYLGGETVVTTVSRVASPAEILAAGKPFTRRLTQRAANHRRTFSCAVVAPPALTNTSAGWLKSRLTGQECGVMVVTGKSPDCAGIYMSVPNLHFSIVEIA